MVELRSATKRTGSPQVHDSNGHESPIPVKKRRQEGKESPRKRPCEERRGLGELCLDELYIIFAYVYPMDLLNLARSCKFLRGVLMHKSSRFLWTSALQQIADLPACPIDLTEPEYTNLVFSNHCHGCSKLAQTILWNMRRRYCPACRAKQLKPLNTAFYDEDIIPYKVLPSDRCKVGKYSGKWLDRDQMDSFLREYHRSSDKEEFLNQKRERRQSIYLHATECTSWQKTRGRVHRHRLDLDVLLKEQRTSIAERLRQRGYGPEIEYFGCELIYNHIFSKKYNALALSELDQIWPKCVEIMDNLRSRRLKVTLHLPRRRSLVSEYDRYVARRSPSSPIFDVLPHVVDLARFPPFQHIIKGPEGAPVHGELFAPAFLPLPALVDEWKKQLDAEVAELVKIPPQLPSKGVPSDRVVVSSSAESHQTNADKLRLACALFHTGGYNQTFTYPEVLITTSQQRYPSVDEDMPRQIGPLGQLGFKVLEEAPYIVHACGLDPNVATVEDMDRRNARIRCLCCKSSVVLVMDWRFATSHARYFNHRQVPLTESPRWQLIDDEHIDMIQAVEQSLGKESPPSDYWRCLLCQPRVGDAMNHCEVCYHLNVRHNVGLSESKRGVHYEHLGVINKYYPHVEMVEEGGQVIFRRAEYQSL